MRGPFGPVEMSVIGGIFGLAATVAVAVQVTLPSDADLAEVGSQAGLPTLAPAVLRQIDLLVRPSSTEQLEAAFGRYEYVLDDVRAGGDVPRIYVTALPPDMPDLQSIDQRKALFIRTVLPLVLMANQQVLETRQRVESLREKQAKGIQLHADDESWLQRVRERYGVPEDSGYDALLKRVDVIPASLALAQAIEESGWGTSRFARKGNSIYGQRTWSEQTLGMVPKKREASKSHRVRSYMNLMGGVRSYIHNLNSHPAYQDFRRERAQQRAAGADFDGYQLIGSLGAYSERGPDYIAQIRGLMRTNKLRDLDGVQLVSGEGPNPARLSQADSE